MITCPYCNGEIYKKHLLITTPYQCKRCGEKYSEDKVLEIMYNDFSPIKAPPLDYNLIKKYLKESLF